MNFHIVCGDALSVLRELPDSLVQCVCSSPPYYGLRRYLPPGHPDEGKEIGKEQTPEEYVANLVAVFREVRRVLRDDGVCWLNLGQSYSNVVPNVPDSFNSLLKECLVFGFDTQAITSSPKGVDVSSKYQRTPDGKFLGLFGAEGEPLEEGQDDLSHVLDLFAAPSYGRAGCGGTGGMVGNMTTCQIFMYEFDGAPIVLSYLNSDTETEFAVLRAVGARAGENNNRTFPVEKSREPGTKRVIQWHSFWDTFSFAASRKSIPNVNPMNNAITLRDSHLSLACLFRDFQITAASEKEVTFTSIKFGFVFTVSDIRHLLFSFSDGSVVPYKTLYDKSILRTRLFSTKQEIDTPNMTKTALQEDGWICRQTIIWHKPNPMPESVTDRCTKAHEYVFLLSKSPRYFFDADAIREPHVTKSNVRNQRNEKYGTARGSPMGAGEREFNHPAGRNKRSVWTITPKPFPGSHFACFPPDLVEPMIKAGTSEKGCCPKCKSPWKRQITKGEPLVEQKVACGADATGNYGGESTKGHDGAGVQNASDVKRRILEGMRERISTWIPGCSCDESPIPCLVLDPFAGAGTTLLVAVKLGRRGIGIELNQAYVDMANKRIQEAE